MPISSDPNATAEYWLAVDESKPIENRPVFLFRYMTRREHARVNELRKQASQAKEDAECFRLLAEAILIGLVGWRNLSDRDGLPLAFSREDWDQPLTATEIWEMAWNFPTALLLAEADKKKSASRSQTATAASASDAATADAPTSPAS